jgi:hypothetical protein
MSQVLVVSVGLNLFVLNKKCIDITSEVFHTGNHITPLSSKEDYKQRDSSL